jgi:hypothetical protein
MLKKDANKPLVGEFSNNAPILRKSAQQDEPGFKYAFSSFILLVFLLMQI